MLKINLKRASHASVLLLFFMVLKSLLGLLLKRSIAGAFGAGIETDAYFAAFTVPQQLGDFVIGGIIFKVVIPVFQQRREDVGDKGAIKDVSGILNYSALLLLLLTVIYFLFIPKLIPFLFSGFNDETRKLTILLSRWLSPAIILMGLSLIYVAFYHAHKSFFVPALSTLLFPVSSIAALYLLPGNLGIMRLVYGNLFGVSLGIFILIMFLKDKFKWCWNWNLANSALRTTLIVAWPLLICNLIGKIIPFVQKNIASRLPSVGNISLLEYAFFLSGTTLIFIASPIATAVFPLMGEQKARGDDEDLIATFHQAVKVVVFLALPCTIFFALESQDIVALLLKNGKFSAEDTTICANLIAIIAIMIVPQSISLIMANIFLVYHETKKIAFSGSILALLSIPVYWILSRKYGIYGIAITYSFSYILGCVVNILLLRLKHARIIASSFMASFIKFFIVGVILVICIFLMTELLTFLYTPCKVAVIFIVSSIIYLVCAHILRIDGVKFIFSKVLSTKF